MLFTKYALIKKLDIEEFNGSIYLHEKFIKK
jgi:hypothetical protein